MSEYGPFANLVAVAGCLSAAATGIRLAWMKRTKWQPPEEALPDAVGKLASLFSMIVVAVLYAFGANRLGQEGLGALSLFSFLASVIFLCATIYVNVTLSYLARRHTPSETRVLGGFSLTSEALRIRSTHGTQPQQMFDDAQWDKDLVWTRGSQALASMASAISYIGLIASGTTAMASAANLAALVIT